jgi:hypothetical protein
VTTVNYIISCYISFETQWYLNYYIVTTQPSCNPYYEKTYMVNNENFAPRKYKLLSRNENFNVSMKMYDFMEQYLG